MSNNRQLYQLLILEDRLRMPSKMKVFNSPKRYKFAYGGRGGGKSESIAKLLLYRANNENIRILCAREIQNSIKESVYTLLVDQIKALEYTDFEPTQNSIRNIRTGSEFIFTGFYGQERKQTMKSMANVDIAWVEEAQVVSEASLKLLDPTIRKEKSEIWFSFNRLMPDDPVWLFKEKISCEDKIEVLINYCDNPYLPNVLKDQAERDKTAYESKLNEDYPHIWLGDPIGLSDRNIFKLREVDEAMTRTVNPEGRIEIGADIARYGNDRIIFVKRKGLVMTDMQTYKNLSVVETANYLKIFAGNDKSTPIKVDDTGVGGGVTDILKSDGYNAIPVNFGQTAGDADKYPNAISEMWFSLKNQINQVQLLSDQELKSELATREWKVDNKGRRCVESKDDYKKRYYKSPDKADACLLAFYEPEIKTNLIRVVKNFW